MEIFRWVLFAVVAFLPGFFLVQYLIAHPLKVSRVLLMTLLSIMVAVLIALSCLRGWDYLVALPLFLILFICSYWLKTIMFFRAKDIRISPPITRLDRDHGKGHTAIIYFAYGETETYDPIGWINQFSEFDYQGVRFIPRLVRPIFAY
jgi:hypothetical protein